MSLLDLFKRKKGKKEPKEVKAVKEPKDTKEVIKSSSVKGQRLSSAERLTEGQRPSFTKASKPKRRKKRKIDQKLALLVLRAPHITEKATDLKEKDQYTFRVSLNSNKIEIKKAVEQLYNVDVLSVKIIKIPRKRRRVGRISGWRKVQKKAIVKIGRGQKIDELTI